MKEIKQRKERRFLKTLGRVGEILVEQVLLKLGSSIIKKIGGKKTLPSILFLFLSLSLFAQYPATGNKQRLGYQTTGDGLLFRGRANDTMALKPSTINNAYFILDTVNNVLFNYIKTKGGWQFSNGDTIIINNNFTQPVDSLFFNVGVPTDNVDTAKMRWDSNLATVVLGLNDNVSNELGFKNFWLVKNQTGATITKGSLVYANGTLGASGRITVAKFIANGSIDAKYLLGITAHDLSNGEDGYVISFGKIRKVNTDTFAAGAILYPSPTVAGVWTDVEPIAPNIDMPIGFCINSHVNNGTIAIRVASGYKLNELHDVAISSPVDKASLYYRGGLWRDTTAAILTSDTASMLTPYFRDADTTQLNLNSRFATKLNISDTASMLTNYLRTGMAAGTYVPLNTESTINATLNINGNLNIGTGGVVSTPILSAGTIIKQGGTSSQFLKANGDIDSNTYLTTGTAASTYLTGSGTTNYLPKFTGAKILGNSLVYDSGTKIGIGNNNPNYLLDLKTNDNAKIFLRGGIAQNGILFDTISSVNSFYLFNGTLTTSGFGIYDVTNNINRLWVKNDGNIGVGTTTPSAKLDVNGAILTSRLNIAGGNQNSILLNNASNGITSGFLIGRSFATNNIQDLFIYDIENAAFRLNINSSGNIGIGTTNPAAKLEVHGSAVFNEGSTDSDFRVESDGNANMVFVDASTDRVGIGTNAPTKTLEVNGELRINTVTATPSSLLGKDGSNVVGNVRLTSPLSLAGDSLNLETVPISKGGTGAESASVARTTLGIGYTFFSTTTGATILFSSNRVSLVITGTGSTTTIDLTTATNGRQYIIKNLSNATVISSASNVIPLTGGSAGTAILSAGNVTPQWVTLVADGTNWHVMQRN